MSTLLTEVETLRQQLVEKEAMIEQQQREVREKKERSWKYNIGVLEKNTTVMTRHIGASCATAAYPGLVPIVNCFKRLDDSMSHIENVITNLDERLTHIERFLIDDIKKEEFLAASQNSWEKAAEKSADALIAKMSTRKSNHTIPATYAPIQSSESHWPSHDGWRERTGLI